MEVLEKMQGKAQARRLEALGNSGCYSETKEKKGTGRYLS